jgi:hypothetical protein
VVVLTPGVLCSVDCEVQWMLQVTKVVVATAYSILSIGAVVGCGCTNKRRSSE